MISSGNNVKALNGHFNLSLKKIIFFELVKCVALPIWEGNMFLPNANKSVI